MELQDMSAAGKPRRLSDDVAAGSNVATPVTAWRSEHGQARARPNPRWTWEDAVAWLFVLGIVVFGLYPLFQLPIDQERPSLQRDLWVILFLAPSLFLLVVCGGIAFVLRRGRRAPPTWRATLTAIPNHWSFEAVQLVFSTCMAVSYIGFSYSARPIRVPYPFDEASRLANATTDTVFYAFWFPPFNTQAAVADFTRLEYTMAALLFTDLVFRLCVCPRNKRLPTIFSFYTCVDVCAFFAVAYYDTLSRDALWNQFTVYSLLLLTGPFRFLRMRRALKALDSVRPGTGSIQFLPGVVLSSRTVGLVLLSSRAILFLFIATSLVMVAEFPCEFIGDGYPDDCNPAFQQFHLSLYFVVVTFSTVGYGDLYAATDAGRGLLTILIVVMLIAVPSELAALGEYFEPDDRMDRVVDMATRLCAHLDVDILSKRKEGGDGGSDSGSTMQPLTNNDLSRLEKRLQQLVSLPTQAALVSKLGGDGVVAPEDCARFLTERLFQPVAYWPTTHRAAASRSSGAAPGAGASSSSSSHTNPLHHYASPMVAAVSDVVSRAQHAHSQANARSQGV